MKKKLFHKRKETMKFNEQEAKKGLCSFEIHVHKVHILIYAITETFSISPSASLDGISIGTRSSAEE